MRAVNPQQIECLACGAVRVTFGTGLAETGECRRCGYLGWTYSEDLDSTTERMIMNGALARRPRDDACGGTGRQSGGASL